MPDAAPAVENPASELEPLAPTLLQPSDTFVHRHIGPSPGEVRAMLERVGADSLDDLSDQTVPEPIRLGRRLDLGEPRGEHEMIAELRQIASRNRVVRSLLGCGYHGTITPPVIQRNILENPGWYTQYTPYQAEISQGRLEALLNFQTMIADLTGLPLANASLLDEATAAAEAMAMCRGIHDHARNSFAIARDCHPQTIEVVRTRAASMGMRLLVVDAGDLSGVDEATRRDLAGLLAQYPSTDGSIVDPRAAAEFARACGALMVVSADPLALTLLTPPGELGADIAVGSTQRFGVPMGLGGPHAAYMATRAEHARRMPGRIVGVSRDAAGAPALRLALQTREQHIRRERATSNICTAQVLLAVMASMYGVYHGPEGLTRIARRVRAFTGVLADAATRLGHEVLTGVFFDTLRLRPRHVNAEAVIDTALARGYNLRDFGDGTIGVTLDERTTQAEVADLIDALKTPMSRPVRAPEIFAQARVPTLPGPLRRRSSFMTHPVFSAHHGEHEMLRYMAKLQSRDLSLAQSMIPLGSCTMKLNGTSEMLPASWPEFADLHPHAPREQWQGSRLLFSQLERWLCEITGFAAVWLQPNAGSQGEYAGLLAIRAWHASRGEARRDVCLIPESAHGTNPASAVIAGFRVVPVKCDERGDVDVADLTARADEHRDRLAALMVTYPSTHGVFETGIREICRVVHERGGQVYMDGANMNAQVGLCRPGDIGADVCHLNLHKTFCIPHGGGGPGMGPIGVAAHLAGFLPRGGRDEPPGAVGRVSAADFGSPLILSISWVYIALMGAEGLRRATQVAILNANYMARRLEGHYDILFRGAGGRVAHEFIVDCRPFERAAGVKVEDIAKRLMDYGFHAPTMSWPVPGTLMIEPTESESKEELDRFCEAMIAIREEIRAIERGAMDRTDNPLKHAPHTALGVAADAWPHAYGREQAAYPAPWLREHKFWPSAARIDNPYGDRNLFCTCPPMEGTTA